MARVFDGSTQYLSAASTLLTNEPIDMIAYTNADALTATMTMVGLGNTGAATGAYQLIAAGASAGDPVNASKQNDAGTAGAALTTPGGLAAGVWSVASAKYISDTSRDSFVDGGNKGSNTTNVTDPTPDTVSVGAVVRSAAANHFDGLIAEAYILDVNMTDAQHALVGKGISPFWIVPGKNVRAWYPLNGHNNNRVRNGYPNLSATGSPTNGMHPARVLRPRINGVMSV